VVQTAVKLVIEPIFESDLYERARSYLWFVKISYTAETLAIRPSAG